MRRESPRTKYLLHGGDVSPIMSSRNKGKTKDKTSSSSSDSIGWGGETDSAIGSNDYSVEGKGDDRKGIKTSISMPAQG